MAIATILLLIITALGLASAVALAQLRDTGPAGARDAPAGPLPFANSVGALQRNAGGGRSIPSCSAAAGTFLSGARHGR